jgi:hypothetical protein
MTRKKLCIALALAAALIIPLIVWAQRSQTEKFKPRRVVSELPPVTDFEIKSSAEVDDQLNPDELVIGVELDGQSRTYPINMLTGPQREIINDELAGTAIAATW